MRVRFAVPSGSVTTMGDGAGRAPAPGVLTRRRLLIGGSGVLVAGAGLAGFAGVLPGQAALDRRLGRCDVEVPEPRAAAGPLVRGEFASAQLRRQVAYTIAYPPGRATGARLPVCLLLHGAGWRQDGWFRAMRFHRHLADAVVAGAPPFALAAADGGPLFWHRRANGDDPQAMLTDEFLPLLAARGLRVAGIGVLGCSMGGYGALLLGAMRPDLCAAVVASSPAVWASYTGGGAFDSAADFRRYDVLHRAGALAGTPVRVDCGEQDPGRSGSQALARQLPSGSVHFSPGCHDPRFWEQRAPAQLAFVAGHLPVVPGAAR
jgi:acetyl esterase/lipase